MSFEFGSTLLIATAFLVKACYSMKVFNSAIVQILRGNLFFADKFAEYVVPLSVCATLFYKYGWLTARSMLFG